MSDHAKHAPSAAHRWMRCYGSLAATADLPRTDSRFSAEGTAAHIIYTRALNYKRDAAFFRDETVQVGEFVFTVGDEMIEALQMSLDETRARAKGAELMVDCKFDLAATIGLPDEFGTGDAVVVDVPKRHLTVLDLKYGMGVKVYAERNEQMMLYALGALEMYELAGDFDFITMVILQPRLDHIDEWVCSVEDLLAFRDKVQTVVKLANPARIPGEKQCRFCEFKPNCPELAAMVSKEIYDDFEAIDDPGLAARRTAPIPSSNEMLGIRLGNLPLILDWAKSVRAEGERRVMAGEAIIGADGLPFKIVEGKSPGRKWMPDHVETITGLLVGVLGDKAYEPQTIITCGAAAKILDKSKTKATWATFGEYYTKARGKPSIVKGSDPRPPYEGNADASEFDPPDELAE